VSRTEYDGSQIRQVAFPRWGRDHEGAWVRDWEITFTCPIDAAACARLATLTDDTMTVEAAISDDRRLVRLGTRTVHDAYSDELFFAVAYRLLRRINDDVAEIELIQGQPRDWWFPFRPESQ
jgi:hypothetical protein